MKRDFSISVVFVIAALFSRATARPSRAESRPNILFIAIDDLNDWVGCLGAIRKSARRTSIPCVARNVFFQRPLPGPALQCVAIQPHDRIAAGHDRHLRAFAGIRAVASLKDHVTLPQYFGSNGYFTFTCGKVYHDGSIAPKIARANSMYGVRRRNASAGKEIRAYAR